MENQENSENKNLPEVAANKKNNLNLSSAILIAAVIIGGAIFMNRGDAKVSGGESDRLDLIAKVSDEDLIRGDKNAEITIIEYADFSCHFCGQYHPTLIKLVDEYKGKVRWVYRHLPIFNMEAAIAGQCTGKVAGDEAFWKFADVLFSNSDKFSTEYYQKTAVESGADAEAYNKCINDPLVKSSIQKDFNEARILLGFNATPYTVLVDKNGKKFPFAGALSYESVKGVIDRLLE